MCLVPDDPVSVPPTIYVVVLCAAKVVFQLSAGLLRVKHQLGERDMSVEWTWIQKKHEGVPD